LLNALIGARREHVLTIENPIEHIFARVEAHVTQRQIGPHTGSFSRALRAALREDPDVIAITELRDRETISLAMSAAETGHLVLGTLHTGNATQTVNRIISVFPADEQSQARVMLSESLRAVVSQRLIRRADGPGRVPAVELLMVTNAVSAVIREGRTFKIPSMMQTGRAQGMITLDVSLQQLVNEGLVAVEEARRYAVDKSRFGGAAPPPEAEEGNE
jgi:twitching motility protein PilT